MGQEASMNTAVDLDEWVAVATATDVTTQPRAVSVGGVPLVVLRLTPDGPAVAYGDRCPHRLVPLSAGRVEDGRLRCAYHGWEFAADGTCADLPSLGPGASVSPRAHLVSGPRVRESDGTVWLRRDEVAAAATDGPADLLTNVDMALLHAWHPVALSAEVGTEASEVLLAGRSWVLWRTGRGRRLAADPAPHGLRERWGAVWLAPERPVVDLFDDPDAEDEAYVGAWLPPARTPVSAGLVADNFLDVAHFPFVHAGTFGAAQEKTVPPIDLVDEPDGCRSVQEQWFDNPEDPGVAAGLRPVRQRRRATYIYRAPFQLMLRLEELDAGAVKTILFFAQPETLTSTRIYTKMLLYGIGGVERPTDDVVAREVAFEEAVLAEDLTLQRQMTLTGLPLRMRDELHVRADRLGVALRRHLRRFAEPQP
jgi:phenylpropionate dioxygenase-like ring-hydroxylating dioxygenase large terminal subunit